MKKYLLPLVLLVCGQWVAAQDSKYEKAMLDRIAKIDALETAPAWGDMAAGFERIANAEKTQWLPYYYAALGYIMQGYFSTSEGQTPSATVLDPLAEKAEGFITQAESLSGENDELLLLKKMAATLRMMVDPMSRWQTYGPKATEALAKAKKLNPDNPRIYLLEGQDMLYTPEEFGGSKVKAKEHFEKAAKLFESFQPKDQLYPVWGKNQVTYFLTQVN